MTDQLAYALGSSISALAGSVMGLAVVLFITEMFTRLLSDSERGVQECLREESE